MKIQSLSRIERDDKDGSLVVVCVTDTGEQRLELPRAQVIALLSGISGMPMPRSGHPIDYGTIHPNSIDAFQDEDGPTGLRVVVGSVALHLAIPLHAIDGIQNTLAQVKLLQLPSQGSA